MSARLAAIAESATLAVDAKAKALKAAGRPVIGFGAGEPDFPTPDVHRRRRHRRREGPRRTTATRPPPGLPALREAIAAKTLRDSGYEVKPSSVLVTNGGKQAVYQSFAAIVDPGDEVLLPAPYWTTYPEAIRLAGGVPVEVFAGVDQGYLVTVEQLEAARTPRTKVLLFCSPSNPTGAVYSPEQTAAIGRWALEHGIWVITDEIYEHLTYDDAVFTPDRARGAGAGGHDDRAQRRRQDLRDDRLAGRLDDRPRRRDHRRDEPAVAPHVERRERVAARRDRRARPATSRPSRRCGPRSTVVGGRSSRCCRRSTACGSPRPRGAFYVYPSVEGVLGRTIRGVTPRTSAELATLILEQAEVAVVPGEAFGPSGYLRLSYALSDADLVEGVTRIQSLLAEAE